MMHKAWSAVLVMSFYAIGIASAADADNLMQAYQRCFHAIAEPVTKRTSDLAKACKDLFNEPSCRATLSDLDNIAPEKRMTRFLDTCLKPDCLKLNKPLPRFCLLDLQKVEPSALTGLLNEFHWTQVRQRECPKFPVPKPIVCTRNDLPKNARQQQEWRQDNSEHFQVCLGHSQACMDQFSFAEQIESLKNSIVSDILIGSISADEKAQVISKDDNKTPALMLHLVLKGSKLHAWVDGQPEKTWLLPISSKASDLKPLQEALKDQPGKPSVILSMAEEVPYQVLVVFMDALREIGFAEVVISSEPKT